MGLPASPVRQCLILEIRSPESHVWLRRRVSRCTRHSQCHGGNSHRIHRQRGNSSSTLRPPTLALSYFVRSAVQLSDPVAKDVSKSKICDVSLAILLMPRSWPEWRNCYSCKRISNAPGRNLKRRGPTTCRATHYFGVQAVKNFSCHPWHPLLLHSQDWRSSALPVTLPVVGHLSEGLHQLSQTTKFHRPPLSCKGFAYVLSQSSDSHTITCKIPRSNSEVYITYLLCFRHLA